MRGCPARVETMIESPTRAAAPLARFAGGCVLLLLFAVTYAQGVHTYPGQLLDDDLMRMVSGWFGIDIPQRGLLADAQFPAFLLALVILGIVLVRRPSIRRTGYAGMVVAGTVAAAFLLKSSMSRPALGVGAGINSFPSNTVAGFAAVGFTIIAVVSPAVRDVVRLVVIFLLACLSGAVVALQWHRPTDVIGALLLAGAVSMISSAFLGSTRPSSSKFPAPVAG